MELETVPYPHGATVISVAGEMDMYNAHELKKLAGDVLSNGTAALILDLMDLSYIDSSGVSALIFVFTQAKKQSVHVWYAGIHGTVRRVIELTSLLNFFPIVERVDDALTQLSRA